LFFGRIGRGQGRLAEKLQTADQDTTKAGLTALTLPPQRVPELEMAGKIEKEEKLPA